jgi:hypothetical protein
MLQLCDAYDCPIASLNPRTRLKQADHHALALGANVRVAIRVLNHLRDDDDENESVSERDILMKKIIIESCKCMRS